MQPWTIRSTALCLWLSPVALLWAEVCCAGPNEPISRVTISAVSLEVTGGAVDLRYQVTNGSSQEIWLCQDLARGWSAMYESYFRDENETLVIRRRLVVPREIQHNVGRAGSYVCLRPGKTRGESLLLPLCPEPGQPIFAKATDNKRASASVKRIAIEIGYYRGNLYGTLYQMCYDEYFADKKWRPKRSTLNPLRTFVGFNEHLRDREERIVVPWSIPLDVPEEILRMTVDWPHVPDDPVTLRRGLSLPDIGDCSRIEIRYAPTILEYFYPHGSQQVLLSSTEKEYLEKQRETVITDRESIFRLNALLKLFVSGGQEIACTDRVARIKYYSDIHEGTLTLYADEVLEVENKHRFAYVFDSSTLAEITRQTKMFELRFQCASNLRDWWHRFRLYDSVRAGAVSERRGNAQQKYPEMDKWCDVVVRIYRETRPIDGRSILRCPSGGEGRSHYAMNPNCGPNSAGDMVLLFETRAGWNQHGGPELFTFDNHDPKGGCVLLNDGTVKFIRTEEELHALRWK